MASADRFSGRYGPIAYLTGEYPKVSHTFILREIAALRAQSVRVLACTVRRAADKDVVGDDQQAEAAATFCIVEHAKKAPHRLIGAHLVALARSPLRWFSALSLAWRTRPPGMKASLWQLFYFAEAGLLAQHLRRNGVVHLHNHFGNSSCSVAMLTSAISGIPFSFTLHGPAEFYAPTWWRLDEKISRASFVVCISHFARSQAMAFSDPAHWDKLKIVHCGVMPATHGQHPHEKRGNSLLFVGRLAAVKGVPLLLEAVAAIRKAHPEVRLTVVGDGPDRDALERHAKALGVSDVVTFSGYQPQDAVTRLMDRADVVVLPSFAEGVPVVLMEAMASRLPVIASQIAGVPELVEDGVSGFVVRPGDLKSLTGRIGQLLSDPALCARMGAAGRRKVEAEFDVDAEAARLATLFSGAASEPQPSPSTPAAEAELTGARE